MFPINSTPQDQGGYASKIPEMPYVDAGVPPLVSMNEHGQKVLLRPGTGNIRVNNTLSPQTLSQIEQGGFPYQAPARAVQPNPMAPAPAVQPNPLAPAPAVQSNPLAPAPAVQPNPLAPAPAVQPNPLAPAPAVQPNPFAPAQGLQNPMAPAPIPTAPVDPFSMAQPTPTPAGTIDPFQQAQGPATTVPVQPQRAQNESFEQFTAKIPGVDLEWAKQAYSSGLNSGQAALMWNNQSQRLEGERQRKNQELATRLNTSQSFLKGAWGKAYDQNIVALKNYVEAYIPKTGNEVQDKKALESNLRDVLQNHVLAKSIFDTMVMPSLQNQGLNSGVQTALPTHDANAKTAPGNALQQIEQEWKSLMMDSNSDLYSNDPYKRKAAVQRKQQLDLYLFKNSNANQAQKFQEGFLKGIA